MAADALSALSNIADERIHVAKPNYQFEKRQRELEKKKKKEQKAQRKEAASGAANTEETTPETVAPPEKE